MKSIRVIAAALIIVWSFPCFAIEGLQISVQCPNVVLSWPSVEGETYIVQYRPDLSTNSTWTTLTNSLPAQTGTNITSFVHANAVQCSQVGGASPSQVPLSSTSTTTSSTSSQPLVMKADGSSPPVPLALYPVGFNLTGFLIFDPLTGDWLDAGGYKISPQAPNGFGSGDPQPLDSGSTAAPDPGFYQVVRVGIHVVGLSNLVDSVVSDSISIPFEAGNPLGVLNDLSVTVDGLRYRGSTPLIAPNLSGGLLVDTTFLNNGAHTFQIEGNWLNTDTFDPNQYDLQQFSVPFTLNVSNVVYFPDWEDEVGEQGFSEYSAQTTCSNTDWQIDIYDVNSNYVQTLSGHTTDGTIETNWNLVDYNGLQRTNPATDPVFTGIITVSDPVHKRVPRKVSSLPFPAHAQWVIAWQDLFYNYYNSNAYYTAFYDMGSIGANNGGAVTLFPSYPTNAQTFPLRWNTTNHPNSFATVRMDVQGFKGLLTNSLNRNLYYCGHATANGMASYLPADEIQYVLLQNLSVNAPKHFYRFVFIDGCSSATGSLPAAFGINFNSAQDITYFQKHGIRPRTFIGYNIPVYWCYAGTYIDPHTQISYEGDIPDSVPEFLVNFETYWYSGYDVSTAIYNAVVNTPYIGSGWATGQNLQVFGYQWLLVDDYNWSYQW